VRQYGEENELQYQMASYAALDIVEAIGRIKKKTIFAIL
jgi:hypothetical protein